MSDATGGERFAKTFVRDLVRKAKFCILLNILQHCNRCHGGVWGFKVVEANVDEVAALRGVVIGSCVACSAFSLFEVLRLQRNNIQRMWIAYVRKERERSELMEIVKQARAAGLIPPADNEMQ
eukprot:g4040.t1